MDEKFFELLAQMTDEQIKEVIRLLSEGFIPPEKVHTP